MLEIRLIGQPRLFREGVPIPGPRGAKCWALLARLVRTPDPVSRQQLVNELFAEADDPMGALRTALAELRRRMEMPGALQGNPVDLALEEGTRVDVAAVDGGVLPDPLPHGELLEGIEVQASPSFETWLLVERQRVAGELLGLLRQDALKALSGRDPTRAVALATAMVETAPLEEGPHVVLIKALAASGDTAAAERHVESTVAAFDRELGLDVRATMRAAARPAVTPATVGISSVATSRSLLTAGLAALAAGAVDGGIECLRGAAAAADGAGDSELEATCLFELGTALVHAVRGYDDEGAILLASAQEVADRGGVDEVAAKAVAELAYIDVLAARRDSAVARLSDAWVRAERFPKVRASIAAYEAVHLSDWGRLDESLDRFDEAIDLCQSTGSVRRGIWAMACAARTAYLAGWLPAAARWAKEAQRQAHSERWTAILPWPEAWHAHARLARGEDPALVRADLESTYALARQLQDPCWEGMAAKAMALTYVKEGAPDLALPWLDGAGQACRRMNDSYRWVDTDVAVTEAEIAAQVGDHARALAVGERALEGAARGDMPLLLARAEAVLSGLPRPLRA